MEWLRANLAEGANQLDSNGTRVSRFVDPRDESRYAVMRGLELLKLNPRLASLRDPEQLELLPDSEAENCRAFWTEVEEVLAKAAK